MKTFSCDRALLNTISVQQCLRAFKKDFSPAAASTRATEDDDQTVEETVDEVAG